MITDWIGLHSVLLPLQIGGKTIFGNIFQILLVARFSDNIQATISAFRLNKNMSINPKSVEFHQCHGKPHSICFFITISKITKEILPRFVVNWKHRLGLESARAALCKWATCTRQTFLSKTFAKSLNIQKQYEKMFGKRVITRTRCR